MLNQVIISLSKVAAGINITPGTAPALTAARPLARRPVTPTADEPDVERPEQHLDNEMHPDYPDSGHSSGGPFWPTKKPYMQGGGGGGEVPPPQLNPRNLPKYPVPPAHLDAAHDLSLAEARKYEDMASADERSAQKIEDYQQRHPVMQALDRLLAGVGLREKPFGAHPAPESAIAVHRDSAKRLRAAALHRMKNPPQAAPSTKVDKATEGAPYGGYKFGSVKAALALIGSIKLLR